MRAWNLMIWHDSRQLANLLKGFLKMEKPSPDLCARALIFASQKHRGQTVPGTDLPYLAHLSSVALEVYFAIQAEDAEDIQLALCCAYLHDTVEDTETTVEEIEELFGTQVARGVLALTKNAQGSKAEMMRDSLKRILDSPREVGLVKLADRISNLMSPPGHWTREKINAYRDEAETILAALGHLSPWLENRLKERIKNFK